jgi:hypothetical protein
MRSRAVSWFKRQHGWQWFLTGLWAILFIGLPITSFPPITRLTGATVAPFSAIPLAVLLLVWFLPYLFRRGNLPKETVPFIAFTLLVIALAAFAFFNEEGTFRNRTLFDQTIRSFIPFAIGLAFFITTSAWHKDSIMLRRSLQWIHVGGFLLLVWAVVQAIVVYKFQWQYPPLLEAIKSALVTQSQMTGNPRLSGLTWEPSWFAHQLNMLYLPLWLAASYQRTSVFPKLWKMSVENVFLVIGMVVFFLSSPRIGGAACMLMLLFLFIKFNLAVYRWIIRRLSPLWVTFKQQGLIKLGIGILLVILFLGIYAGFSAITLKIVSERDWRVGLLVNSPLTQSEISKLSALDENTLYYLGLRFAFVERTVYWMDGWRIFNDYPLLGVGLGNTGFYFMDHLPAVGWSTFEVRAIAYRDTSLPNTKSMWYRLLAETGILGFSIFVVWLLVLWSSANASLRSRDATLRTIALAGQLSLLAYVFEGFSVDTFGLPYLFLMAGMIASVGWVHRHHRTVPCSNR